MFMKSILVGNSDSENYDGRNFKYLITLAYILDICYKRFKMFVKTNNSYIKK